MILAGGFHVNFSLPETEISRYLKLIVLEIKFGLKMINGRTSSAQRDYFFVSIWVVIGSKFEIGHKV